MRTIRPSRSVKTLKIWPPSGSPPTSVMLGPRAPITTWSPPRVNSSASTSRRCSSPERKVSSTAEQHNDCDNLRGRRGDSVRKCNALDAAGRVIARHAHDGLGWEVDPKSLEGDAGELATRPKLEGT